MQSNFSQNLSGTVDNRHCAAGEAPEQFLGDVVRAVVRIFESQVELESGNELFNFFSGKVATRTHFRGVRKTSSSLFLFFIIK